MPTYGFKVGDRVLTPSRKLATVESVRYPSGRKNVGPERVTVKYDNGDSYGRPVRKEFSAHALKFTN
jgi:hypothetical protein